ncbi:TetR/AcrR family transcriptional regulator [Roseomonas sp. WA12]
MAANVSETRNRPGRPREFDADVALDTAIGVFSRSGYSGTSITDLTEALGLTSGSLYKAFGDKRGLFRAALERYVQRRDEALAERLAGAKTGRQRVEALLAFYAAASHGEAGRTGCLVVGSAVEFASSDPELGRQVASLLAAREARLCRLIQEGQRDGSIGRHVDAVATGRLLLCLVQGMRVVGKTGRARAEMGTVVATALRLLD